MSFATIAAAAAARNTILPMLYVSVLDDSFDDTNRRFVRRIQEVEIGEALKRRREVKRWALMVSPLRYGDA